MAGNELTEELENATQFNNVQSLQCEDKRRFIECRVEQESGGKEFEGRFKASDVVVRNGEVESFSTEANTFKMRTDDLTCRLYEKNGILRCRDVNG